MNLDYYDKFSRLSTIAESFTLPGPRMLVEILPKEELKTAGGLIISAGAGYKTTNEMNRPLFGVILLNGEGEEDEDGNNIPLPLKPGAVVQINLHGPVYYSEFPGLGSTEDQIAMIAPNHIQMSWPTIADFKKFQEVLGAK